MAWRDEKRYELIDGSAYMMSPAPSTEHQRVFRRLFNQLANYLEGKQCEVFSAPFDVRLNADAEDDTVVQPDIAIVCDPKKIEANGCKGAPDMVVEILSPATARMDQLIKFNKYREAGVLEYWIVNPETKLVQVNRLMHGSYVNQAYGDTDTVPVSVLEDCKIDLAKVFAPQRPEALWKEPETAAD